MNPTLHPDFLRLPLAHRALHNITDGRPENSRAAIRAAIAKGYAIEIDVQCSADDQAMVFHDYDLERLTRSTGAICDRSTGDLSQTNLLGGDEGIPTLPEVLELVAGRVPLLIDVKDQDGAMGPAVGPLEASVAAALKSYAGLVAVMSWNPHSVVELAKYAPDVARGLVTGAYDAARWHLPVSVCDRLRDIPDYDRAGCSFISHQADDLSRPSVVALKAAGAGILCWTVKSPQQEAQAREIAHNITFEQYLAPIPACAAGPAAQVKRHGGDRRHA